MPVTEPVTADTDDHAPPAEPPVSGPTAPKPEIATKAITIEEPQVSASPIGLLPAPSYRGPDEAIGCIYSRDAWTCEEMRSVSSRFPLGEWSREDFEDLLEHVGQHACWPDFAHTYCEYETTARVLYGEEDHVLIYDGAYLRVLTWAEARERIKTQLEKAAKVRELERQQRRLRDIMRDKLPRVRKLKKVRELIAEMQVLVANTQGEMVAWLPPVIAYIGRMQGDDPSFAECKVFSDYIKKAAEIEGINTQ
jgi:hypothetical protein